MRTFLLVLLLAIASPSRAADVETGPLSESQSVMLPRGVPLAIGK